MNLDELSAICIEIFGERDSDESQNPTGAAGHIKHYPVNGNGDKILFLARQGGPSQKFSQQFGVSDSAIKDKYKSRGTDDCRKNILTRRKKGEWTGYHAEMLVVNRWIKLLFPSIILGDVDQQMVVLGFKKSQMMITANAPCCKHCHHMLNYLEIAHPVPKELKAGLTGWWNPLNDTVHSNGSGEFVKDIPGF